MRLEPITKAIPPPTSRPRTEHLHNEVTPKYVYVSAATGKPLTAKELSYLTPPTVVMSSTATPTPTTSIKLKPSYKYAAGHGHNEYTIEPPHQHNQQPASPTKASSKYQSPVLYTPKPALSKFPLVESNDVNQLPDIRSSSLADILHKLQASNHLPQTLTPDNIDNSIRTLIAILNNLKKTQTIVENPIQHHAIPSSNAPSTATNSDYDYNTAAGGNNQEEYPHSDDEYDTDVDLSHITATGPSKY